MSETPQKAQESVAAATRGVSDPTKAIVRHEIAAAEREMLDKARQSLPSISLLGAAGLFGVLSASASYRLSVRLLEKVLPPATAASVAAAGYGAAAGVAGAIGIQRLRGGRLLPVDAVRQTVRQATDTAKAVTGTTVKKATDTAKSVSGTSVKQAADTAKATATTAARKAADTTKKAATGTTARTATDRAKATAATTARKATDTAKKATATTTAKKAADTTKKAAGTTARAARSRASQPAGADQPETSSK